MSAGYASKNARVMKGVMPADSDVRLKHRLIIHALQMT
jgi:hypothetical protein